MRPSPLSCLTAGLLVAFAFLSPTQTQAQGPSPRQSLLLQESVQNDLGLSDKQKSQLSGLQAGFGQKSRDTFQSLQENGAEPQEFQEAMVALHREHQASLSRVLDKNQKTRMAQIELQREGFLAASRSETASKLKLTPAQTKKIKTIVDEMRRANASAMPAMLGALQAEGTQAQPKAAPSASKSKKGTTKTRRPANNAAQTIGTDEMGGEGEFGAGGFAGGEFMGGFAGGGPPGGLPDFLKPENQPDFAKIQEAQKKNRDEANTKIGEVLTAEQKTGFEKLTGKPFDFSKLQTATSEPQPTEVAQPKADDAMKKEATPAPKSEPKSRFKKSNRD